MKVHAETANLKNIEDSSFDSIKYFVEKFSFFALLKVAKTMMYLGIYYKSNLLRCSMKTQNLKTEILMKLLDMFKIFILLKGIRSMIESESF